MVHGLLFVEKLIIPHEARASKRVALNREPLYYFSFHPLLDALAPRID